jgi:hypothetical protein
MAATAGAEQRGGSPSPDGAPGGSAGSGTAAPGGGTAYRHVRYDELVTFDFLLPLTREDRLRRALDDLFYADTIARRLGEIGLDRFAAAVPRAPGLGDGAYAARIADLVAERFVGYSISHVNGRYRAAGLLTRREAGDLLLREGRYLVDETTALVRFIARCEATRRTYDPHALPLVEAPDEAPGRPAHRPDVRAEVRLIRLLFLELFAEAVVHAVEGEDEIWLVENGPTRRLYVWERARAPCTDAALPPSARADRDRARPARRSHRASGGSP